MTLPVSNISASLVNQELLYDSNRTISFGSQAVRLLFQRATGSVSLQNGQNRQGPARITALISSGTLSTFSDISVTDCVQDPNSGVIYLVGQQDFNNQSGSSDDTRGLLIQLSEDGRTVNWARTYRSGLGRYHEINAVALDSAGNVYCVCRSVFGYAGSNILKYNSSGTLLAHASASGATASTDCWYLGVAIDSASGAVYASGYGYFEGGGYGGILVKYNSDLSAVWQRQYQGYHASASKWAQFYQCQVDSSGNVYTVGWTTDVPSWGGYYYALMVKWTGTGQVIWEKNYVNPATSAASCRQSVVKLDSAGNVYMQGWYESTYQHALLTKLDPSNGAVVWSRKQGRTTTTNGTSAQAGLVISSDGSEIYHLTYTFNTIGSWYVSVIYRYDSSGNLQYQRHVGSGSISAQSGRPDGGFIDRAGNLCVAFDAYKGTGDTSRYTIGIYRQRRDDTGARTSVSFQVTHSDGVVKTMPFGYPTIGFTMLESASGLAVGNAAITTAITGSLTLAAGNGTSENAVNLTMNYNST